MFASDLDAASPQLDRGQRLMALLKQPVLAVPAGGDDRLAVARHHRSPRPRAHRDVLRFERELLDYLRRSHDRILSSSGDPEVRTTPPPPGQRLRLLPGPVPGPPGAAPSRSGTRGRGLEDDEVEQEQIVKAAGLTPGPSWLVSLRSTSADQVEGVDDQEDHACHGLIAASRIIKAQQRGPVGRAVRPLSRPCGVGGGDVLNVDHPLTQEPGSTRAAVLIVTSDRGLAGASSSSVLRRPERLERLREGGQGDQTYICGRKGVGVLQFRRPPRRRVLDRLLRPAPRTRRRTRSATTLIDAFLDEDGEARGGRGPRGVHRFRCMLVQEPTDVRLLPLEVVGGEGRSR